MDQAELRTSRALADAAAPFSKPRAIDQLRLWLSGLVGSRYDGLRHFRVVDGAGLMRAGQPRVSDLQLIRNLYGLRTIVCARGGTRHPLRGAWFGKETRFCRQFGVQFVHMPFSDASRPPSAIFEDFIRLAARPENRPILVHCEQGFHRTGVLCAAYRVKINGWTLDDALAEMSRLGFEHHKPKRRLLVDALREYLGTATDAPALRPASTGVAGPLGLAP